jgi:hypothetical protein
MPAAWGRGGGMERRPVVASPRAIAMASPIKRSMTIATLASGSAPGRTVRLAPRNRAIAGDRQRGYCARLERGERSAWRT